MRHIQGTARIMVAPNVELVSQLFIKYGRQLQSFLHLRLKPQDVEDVAQKTYLQLLQHPSPGNIHNLQAYLFRTASNLAVDSLRRDGTRSRHTEQDVDTDEVTGGQPGLEAIVDGELRLRQLMDVLDELPEMCRHAFILHRLDGLGHAEVAERLGISRKTVQRYVLKALEHCQQRMEF
ncbi:MAG: sigma-70 family RNA polymerase sigma factor [Gammaproteobacteria bacterium]|nr:sigma-70 family RNA polymerase sigma factor [Gammaproteobacteria bacterium]